MGLIEIIRDKIFKGFSPDGTRGHAAALDVNVWVANKDDAGETKTDGSKLGQGNPVTWKKKIWIMNNNGSQTLRDNVPSNIKKRNFRPL